MKQDDTSKQCQEILVELTRKMPLSAKVRRIFDMYETGRVLSMAGLRQLHPDVGEAGIWRLWARHHLGDELYEKAYGGFCDE